jgi:hypothetical protein
LIFSTIGHQVLDADVVLDPPRQQLVLDLDRLEAGGLRQPDGAMDVHGVAPTAAGVEDDRQRAGRAHVDRDLRHLGQRDVGLGHAFVPAERAAAHVDRLEARLLGHPRHDRVERHRRDDELVAADELTEFLQEMLLTFLRAYLLQVTGRGSAGDIRPTPSLLLLLHAAGLDRRRPLVDLAHDEFLQILG